MNKIFLNDNEQLKQKIVELKHLQNQIKELQTMEKEIKEYLINNHNDTQIISNDENFKYDLKINVSLVNTKPDYDIDQMVVDFGIDLSKYEIKKPPQERKNITFSKSKE